MQEQRRRGCGRRTELQDLLRWQHTIAALVVHQSEPELLDVVRALDAASSLACRLHGGKQERNQHGDDCDDNQQFNQSEYAPDDMLIFPASVQSPLVPGRKNLKKVIPRRNSRFKHRVRNLAQGSAAIVVACEESSASHAIDRAGLTRIVGPIAGVQTMAAVAVGASPGLKAGNGVWSPCSGAKGSGACVSFKKSN